MDKRVLRNLGTEDEPFWAYVSVALVPTKQKRKLREAKTKPKAFANPNSWGYGGGETPWPFDRQRAAVDGRYRAGVRNAIHSDWTASNWKSVAKALLIEVIEELITESAMIEAEERAASLKKRAKFMKEMEQKYL